MKIFASHCRRNLWWKRGERQGDSFFFFIFLPSTPTISWKCCVIFVLDARNHKKALAESHGDGDMNKGFKKSLKFNNFHFSARNFDSSFFAFGERKIRWLKHFHAPNPEELYREISQYFLLPSLVNKLPTVLLNLKEAFVLVTWELKFLSFSSKKGKSFQRLFLCMCLPHIFSFSCHIIVIRILSTLKLCDFSSLNLKCAFFPQRSRKLFFPFFDFEMIFPEIFPEKLSSK